MRYVGAMLPLYRLPGLPLAFSTRSPGRQSDVCLLMLIITTLSFIITCRSSSRHAAAGLDRFVAIVRAGAGNARLPVSCQLTMYEKEFLLPTNYKEPVAQALVSTRAGCCARIVGSLAGQGRHQVNHHSQFLSAMSACLGSCG